MAVDFPYKWLGSKAVLTFSAIFGFVIKCTGGYMFQPFSFFHKTRKVIVSLKKKLLHDGNTIILVFLAIAEFSNPSYKGTNTDVSGK